MSPIRHSGRGLTEIADTTPRNEADRKIKEATTMALEIQLRRTPPKRDYFSKD